MSDNVIVGNVCVQPKNEEGNPISYGIEIGNASSCVVEHCVCIVNETWLQRWWREICEAFEQL